MLIYSSLLILRWGYTGLWLHEDRVPEQLPWVEDEGVVPVAYSQLTSSLWFASEDACISQVSHQKATEGLCFSCFCSSELLFIEMTRCSWNDSISLCESKRCVDLSLFSLYTLPSKLQLPVFLFSPWFCFCLWSRATQGLSEGLEPCRLDLCVPLPSRFTQNCVKQVHKLFELVNLGGFSFLLPEFCSQ